VGEDIGGEGKRGRFCVELWKKSQPDIYKDLKRSALRAQEILENSQPEKQKQTKRKGERKRKGARSDFTSGGSSADFHVAITKK